MKKFESEAIELEQKYEQKIASLYESLMLKHRTEIVEVEERKNLQISTLIKNHEKAFTDMKNYYNDITLNNLSLIKTLKVSYFITFSLEKVLDLCKMGHPPPHPALRPSEPEKMVFANVSACLSVDFSLLAR